MSDKIPFGMVVAGGQSSRMGKDKALIEYHGIPQYQWAVNMLSNCCEKVIVACKNPVYQQVELLLDNPQYGDIGPMAAFLSFFQSHAQTVIVLGVDYPLLNASDINHLIENRDPSKLASVFEHPESNILEPMIGIYETGMAHTIRTAFENGENSMQRLLKQSDIKKIVPLDSARLKSFDHPSDFELFFQ